MCRCGLGSEPVAIGEVMACSSPMAVSVEWGLWWEEEPDAWSDDLRFFL